MPYADELYQKHTFIIQLGKALHKLGSTSYRLEDNLRNIAKSLKLQADFIIAPTCLTFILSTDEDSPAHNHLIRVTPGEIDLGALASIDELVDQLTSGALTLEQAINRLDEIGNSPPAYNHLLTFIAFGASSGAFSMLMHTNWHDIFWSVLLGFLVYGFVLWSEHSRRVTEMLEPIAALISAYVHQPFLYSILVLIFLWWFCRVLSLLFPVYRLPLAYLN